MRTRVSRLAVLLPIAWGMPSPLIAGKVEQYQIVTAQAPKTALTPEALADALTCRSDDAFRAFQLQLSGASDSIPWLESYFAEESNGMPSVYAYRTETPLSFFDRTVQKVSFSHEGVFASLPRKEALKLIADKQMERLPAKRTQQYYRFIDPQAGRVLVAFEPEGPAFSAALDAKLGFPHKSAHPTDTIFVGCSYARLSPQNFLKRASLADQRFDAEIEIYAKIARARMKAKR